MHGCGSCLTQVPAYQRSMCAFEYNPAFASLLSRFKEGGDLMIGKQLSQQLAHTLGKPKHIDLLIPIPLHWRRRWQRGFNQSEEICAQLSKDLGIPYRLLLRAKKAHTDQKTLNKKARERNLLNTFTLESDVKGLRIALIDDVITTGATSNTAARLLQQAGAEQVEVWALAKTPKKR